MEREEVRKGPWTEEEDVQLVFYVNLFGDRRWDFIAKVSGLKVAGDSIEVGLFWAWNLIPTCPMFNSFYFLLIFVLGLKRTGKSCRLRWVNYLHPGLKRGKMTPLEERLVLDLHSKWGNRWSRIAQRLPGRTDNEIKNYWRTHMRKKAQAKKAAISQSSSSSSISSSSSNSNSPNQEFGPITGTTGRSFYDTGGDNGLTVANAENMDKVEVQERPQDYSMDEIWKDIEYLSEVGSNFTCQAVNTPIWAFVPSDEYSLCSMDDHFHYFPYYNHKIG